MNIVFMGTPHFAIPSLEILLKNHYNISAVVTAQDKPRGRGQNISYTPVKEFALQHSLPILQPTSLKDSDFITQLQKLNADIFVVVAFRILPKEIFSLPSKGAFNLHASLLPKYRGAAPINWAIINGEKETGVTTFFLQEKVDTGNIIVQEKTPITETMNAGELHDVLSEIGAKTVLQTVRLIEKNEAYPKIQDNALATPAPKIFKKDCKIDWNNPVEKVYDFIRGLSPYPTAYTTHNGKILKIYKVHNPNVVTRETPGTILLRKSYINEPEYGNKQQKFLIMTRDKLLEVTELQQEGKRRMSISEFLRGYNLKEGDVVE